MVRRLRPGLQLQKLRPEIAQQKVGSAWLAESQIISQGHVGLKTITARLVHGIWNSVQCQIPTGRIEVTTINSEGIFSKILFKI